jgi:TonB family protein
MRSWNREIHLVPLQVNLGCTKRGDAGISFTGKNAMGDLATTPELILGGTPSAKNSSRMMQAVGAVPWSTMESHSPDVSILNQPAQMQAAWQPTFATDLHGVKRDPTSNAISFVFHVVVITLALLLAAKARTIVTQQPTTIETPLEFNVTIPPITLPVAKAMGGGGGGGAHEVVEASKGHLPMVAMIQIMPSQILRIDRPKLGVEPTETVNVPDNNKLPNMGLAQSQQVALASQGRGSGSAFGQGLGGGIGAGHGNGAGSGSGGGYGGGLMSVGGGVSAPVVIHSVEPEFTDDARRANYQGSVSIKLIVDSQGNPQDVRLASHLGMGLEEKAIEAVKQYKFKPAMFQGHAVSVQIVIDVDFHLH